MFHRVVGFDWYATGYCISHFDERWGLSIKCSIKEWDKVDLLMKGIRSFPIANRRFRWLFLFLKALFFSQDLQQFCTPEDLSIVMSVILIIMIALNK